MQIIHVQIIRHVPMVQPTIQSVIITTLVPMVHQITLTVMIILVPMVHRTIQSVMIIDNPVVLTQMQETITLML